MDTRPNPLQELFSRSNSPPAQLQHQHVSNTSSPNHLESLFHQLNAPSQQTPSPSQPLHQQQQQQPINLPGDSYSPPAPAEEQAPPPQPTSTERQTALLSLLSGPPSAPRPVQPAQQVPSPPVSHKSNASPSHNEAQGKYLLEQLMAGYVLSFDPAKLSVSKNDTPTRLHRARLCACTRRWHVYISFISLPVIDSAILSDSNSCLK
ncbi:hypothetical protein AX14_006086 [Amanita brunnescens Koide BX004]|nr:hypothetical protein AX14_006086 [Amanita brunnescens Koide BX004]